MTFLVTGFPGFIGRRLVRALLEQHPDAKIVALVEQGAHQSPADEAGKAGDQEVHACVCVPYMRSS